MPELDDARRAVPDIDINQPSDARLYDLLLGGKNNYEVDRQLFQELVKIVPEAPQLASENRRWLAEAIGLMIRDGGIGQFLDLGSGLPAMQNTHDVALAADPKAIVVYVDNDLTAISHGQALLADEHSTYFAGADAEALDLDRPVGIILGLVLHTIADDDQVRRIIADYLAAVPSGSYLAITHPINPRDGSRLAEFATALEDKFTEACPELAFRTPAEVAELVTGLDVVEPGVVDLATWWPAEEHNLSPTGAALLLHVALARKP